MNIPEICAPEFSLYGPDKDAENLPWPERIDLDEKDVYSLARLTRANPLPVMFQVWLADQSE